MAVTDVQTMTVNGRTVKLATNFEIRPGYSPYVGDNGNWYVYDVTVKGFVDTGVSASGNGIATITKTGTSGIVDTYTITFDNGTTTTFTVTNADNSKINAVLADITTVQTTTAAVKNYAVGDLLILNGQLYKVTSAISTGATISVGSNVIATTIEAELQRLDEEKADTDGDYPNMTVGNAEQLVSSMYVEDLEPYKFRTSGGSADIGNRENDVIVGGSQPWNQLRINSLVTTAHDGITTSYNNGIFTIVNNSRTSNYSSGSTRERVTEESLLVNHVYALIGYSDKSLEGVGVAFNSNTAMIPINSVYKITDTDNPTSTPYCKLRITRQYDFVTVHPVGDVTNFTMNLYDLTRMFGTAIADYIYSVEQSQAGAGVALVKKWANITAGYYPYNAGELVSVEGLQSHDMTGFNQWDEEWEVGAFNWTTGEKVSATNRIRSKNYIRVIPGATYFFNVPNSAVGNEDIVIAKYDADKNYLGYTNIYYESNRLQILPDNCYYLMFATISAYGSTYKNDICINLSHSGAKNGTYEPYEKYSYPLDSSLILRGVPKLGADNKMYYDGDTYEADGTVTRRYGIVDLGTLTWQAEWAERGIFRTTHALPNVKKPITNWQDVVNMISSRYVKVAYYINGSNPTELYSVDKANALKIDGVFCIHDSAFINASVDSVKTAMSGVYLVYELATPTTETAEPYAVNQIVNDWGTEEYISGTNIPVGHDTKYLANLRDKLQHLPDLASADGIYAIQQSGSNMELVHIPADVAELPEAPTEDGTYSLKATVSSGNVTYSWS